MKLSPLLLSLACLLSVALALQPGLDDGEFLVDTSGGHAEEAAVVAFDGTNFLTAWTDKRSGYDIYGARVTPQGLVLDPSALVIATAADDRYSPAVAFDGTNCLVVWTDERSGYDIYGARVSKAGTVLDPDGIDVTVPERFQWASAVGFDGTNFLVAWEDGRHNSSIYCGRVTQSGLVLDSSGIPVSTAGGWQQFPAVAFDGTDYLVVWLDDRSGSGCDIYGARVTPAGIVLDAAGIAISTAESFQKYPALAFDGTNYLVTWEDDRGSDYDIYGCRVTPQGSVLDPQGIAISTAVDSQVSPAIAFDGTSFLVVWTDYRSGDYLSLIHI